MKTAPRVHELDGDLEPLSRLAHASLQNGPHAQLLAHLAHIGLLTFEREGGRARDHLEPLDRCEPRDQLFGHAIGEVLVLLIGAQVHERKDGERGGGRHRVRGFGAALAGEEHEAHDAGQGRRRGVRQSTAVDRAEQPAERAPSRLPDDPARLGPEHPHRCRQALEPALPQCGEPVVGPLAERSPHVLAHHHLARARGLLQAGGGVHPVPVEITVLTGCDFSQVDADAQFRARHQRAGPLCKAPLERQRRAHGGVRARELRQRAVTHQLHQPPAVLRQRVAQGGAQDLYELEG